MWSCHRCMDGWLRPNHSLGRSQAAPLPCVRGTEIIVWRREFTVVAIRKISAILPKDDTLDSGRWDGGMESKTISGRSSSWNLRRGLLEYEMHLSWWLQRFWTVTLGQGPGWNRTGARLAVQVVDKPEWSIRVRFYRHLPTRPNCAGSQWVVQPVHLWIYIICLPLVCDYSTQSKSIIRHPGFTFCMYSILRDRQHFNSCFSFNDLYFRLWRRKIVQ